MFIVMQRFLKNAIQGIVIQKSFCTESKKHIADAFPIRQGHCYYTKVTETHHNSALQH